jgi:hypothetical protein
MFIIANHNIQDPDAFWSIVKEGPGTGKIPAHLKLHGMFPSTNSMRAICLWEAESPEAVNTFLRQLLGDTSKDELFEVNEEVAVGLPVVPRVI